MKNKLKKISTILMIFTMILVNVPIVSAQEVDVDKFLPDTIEFPIIELSDIYTHDEKAQLLESSIYDLASDYWDRENKIYTNFQPLFNKDGSMDLYHFASYVGKNPICMFGDCLYGTKTINIKYREADKDIQKRIDEFAIKYKGRKEFIDLEYVEKLINTNGYPEDINFDEILENNIPDDLKDVVEFQIGGYGMSAEPSFFTANGTFGYYVYNDTRYSYNFYSESYKHIIYVPQDTKEDKLIEEAIKKIKTLDSNLNVQITKKNEIVNDFYEAMKKENNSEFDYFACENKYVFKNELDRNMSIFELTINDKKADILIIPKGTRYFESEETGIKVAGPSNELPEGIDVKVSVIKDDTKLNEIKETLNNENIKAYDITLEKENEGSITKLESGSFKVTIPVEEYDSDNHYVVYYIDEKGNVERHKTSTDEEGTISFETNHFSTYIISIEDFLIGDVNDNGKIDLADVLGLLKIYFKSTPTNSYTSKVGNVNGTGEIDLGDILGLLKLYFTKK